MERHLGGAVLDGLTRRARSFVTAHGIRIDVPPVGRLAERWLALAHHASMTSGRSPSATSPRSLLGRP
ncbi:hypothetical protein CW362_26340 [Streptomyces populi]|uniref:Uncharacterized protein n=1 Tax=Streptomyces populi TaxID=2058924 RepID=A0A2I0SJB8_9ACTN|nr:hypothetical protein CW362_26340 [Streptomyces populi]